jgi:hypothetical protein
MPPLTARRAVAFALVAGVAAACAADPTAPRAPAAAGQSSLIGSTSVVTTTSTSSTSSSSGGGTSSVTLTISPTTSATFQINAHKVRIVAGSVCDPATSGYGPTLWDAPCTPAKSTVTVTAKSWTDANGRPRVSFAPDLRFVPGKVNTIWLLDKNAAASQSGVLTWCPTGGTACVDESETDASLVTNYTSDGYAYRRLKHFSGFTIGAY